MMSPRLQLRLKIRDQNLNKEAKETQCGAESQDVSTETEHNDNTVTAKTDDNSDKNYKLKLHIYVPTEFEYDEKKHQVGFLSSYSNWNQDEFKPLEMERKVDEGFIFTRTLELDSKKMHEIKNRIEYKYVIKVSENDQSRIYYELLPGGDPMKNRVLELKDDQREFDVHDGRLLMEKEFPNGWVWWTHQVGRGFQEFGVNANKFFTEDLPKGLHEFGQNCEKFFKGKH